MEEPDKASDSSAKPSVKPAKKARKKKRMIQITDARGNRWLFKHLDAQRDYAEATGHIFHYATYVVRLCKEGIAFRELNKKQSETGEDKSVIPRLDRYHKDKFLGRNLHDALDVGLITIEQVSVMLESIQELDYELFRDTALLHKILESNSGTADKGSHPPVDDKIPEDSESSLKPEVFGEVEQPAESQDLLGAGRNISGSQKQKDANREKMIIFMEGVNELTRNPCKQCKGTGIEGIVGKSLYDKVPKYCKYCNDGYVETPRFAEEEIFDQLAEKLSEDEVRTLLEEACSKKIIISGANRGYHKIPDAWRTFYWKLLQDR